MFLFHKYLRLPTLGEKSFKCSQCGKYFFQRFKVFPTLSIDFGEENQRKGGGNKSKTVELYTPLYNYSGSITIIEFWCLDRVSNMVLELFIRQKKIT